MSNYKIHEALINEDGSLFLYVEYGLPDSDGQPAFRGYINKAKEFIILEWTEDNTFHAAVFEKGKESLEPQYHAKNMYDKFSVISDCKEWIRVHYYKSPYEIKKPNEI